MPHKASYRLDDAIIDQAREIAREHGLTFAVDGIRIAVSQWQGLQALREELARQGERIAQLEREVGSLTAQR